MLQRVPKQLFRFQSQKQGVPWKADRQLVFQLIPHQQAPKFLQQQSDAAE
jgi:hypothetical protein